jgi:hypothetical protein
MSKELTMKFLDLRIVGMVSSCRTAIAVGTFVLIAGYAVSGQTAPPADQFVFTSGSSALPSSLSTTSSILFDSANYSLLPSGETGIQPDLFIQKQSGQHGMFIVDNKEQV